MRVYLATGNEHKVEELRGLLTDCPVALYSAKACGGMPEVIEDGETFAANAMIKAKALLAQAPVGAWVLADDSGLEVDFLGGAPGVRSARYAGEGATDQQNVAKLLSAMNGQPALKSRAARFRCVLCLLSSDGAATFFEGACEGTIARAPTGKTGFGYDPVFIPQGFHASFAKLGAAAKAELSHRALAVAALRAHLKALTDAKYDETN